MDISQYEKYRGLRGLLLTRVSTEMQGEMYGHTWQESQVRKQLVVPLDIKLDNRIVRYAHSGLDYTFNETLKQVLEMAQNGEFDVLLMEVLDRGLGRKALERELYRMQIRETGVHILTCDPEDHADDDTFTGQLMRFIRGYKAQQEVADTVRRSKGGKIAKATGDVARGIPPRVVGSGLRPYGYVFVLDAKGKPEGLELNHEVIHVDATGKEWTEVKVVIFIFESSAAGVSIRHIAVHLNQMGIPSPFKTKGIERKSLLGPPVWQPSGVHTILKNNVYWGEYVQFQTINGLKKPGKQKPSRIANAPEDQITMSVPAIITREFAEAVHQRLVLRQKQASRNNKNPTESLLRIGLIKCGECNGNLTVSRDYTHGPNGYIRYKCRREQAIGRCTGCIIAAHIVDQAAWERTVAIIRDPSEVDQRFAQLSVEMSAIRQKQRTLKDLGTIRRQQQALRSNLAKVMSKNMLDENTVEFLQGQLRTLEQQEKEVQSQLADEQALQEKYDLLQARIAEFHQKCIRWRENLDDPEFTIDYEFKRTACEFFGITVIVYKHGHDPRFMIELRPPSIMSLFLPDRNRSRRY